MRIVAGVVVLGVALLGAALAAEPPALKSQTTCPVSGEAIDKTVHVDYQGQRVYFCCNKCAARFRKDPEKIFSKVESDGVQLENIQTACPVSGEQLGGPDMGAPVIVRYKGRTVKLCCKMCAPKFEKDPAKYLAKLPGEAIPTS
jgi:YHS domain-containing protein